MKNSGRDVWMMLTYGALVAASGAMVVGGLVEGSRTPGAGRELVAAGLASLVVVSAMIPVAVHLSGSRRAAPEDVAERLGQQSELLQRIQEHTMLSDGAKRIAYRRDERERLRRAIEEDIAHEDWEAATVLIHAMAEQFGYRELAEEYRTRVAGSRKEAAGQRLDEAMARLDGLVQGADWSAAFAEAARIARTFPENERARGLERGVRGAWEARKMAVEKDFLDAAGRGDAQTAMNHLKELDRYLTPREAQPYQEVARGVISKAKENVGLQFKLAVQEQDWDTAVRVGETIVAEFPNTLMAREVREVRERIEALRARGGDGAAR